MDFLDEKQRLMYTYPAIAFGISAFLLATTRFMRVPKFFRNPLEVYNLEMFSHLKEMQYFILVYQRWQNHLYYYMVHV
jgi:hypothetical protein